MRVIVCLESPKCYKVVESVELKDYILDVYGPRNYHLRGLINLTNYSSGRNGSLLKARQHLLTLDIDMEMKEVLEDPACSEETITFILCIIYELHSTDKVLHDYYKL